ncbi:MAG TPA: flippase-like domain-containing protein, partial [Rhizobiales bacterium]|nr:flippase-like domain-containing protein [Hyphomicrobiales bacterium]
KLFQLIAGIAPLPLVVAIFLLLALMVPVARRWNLIVSALGGSISYLSSLRMILMTVLVNQSVPSNLGGDAYRVMATSQAGMPWKRATLAAIVDRLIALLALALVALFGVLALLDRVELENQRLITIIGTGAIVGGTLSAWIFFRSRFAATLAGGSEILQRLITALGALLNKPAEAAYLVVLSIIVQCVTIAVMSIVAINVGVDVPLFPMLGVCALGLLISRLPVSLGGWGVREGTLVLGFAPFGISREAALAASITYGLTELAAAIIGGVIWLVWTAASDTNAGKKRQA